MPTLADVAKLAGVGVMSVSRVVNGTRRVSPEVERRVRAAIKKIGYEPNEAARVLKGNRGSVLGLIVPDLADPFFSSCVSVIQETARQAGYMTLMAASGHREDVERRETELMVQRRVAGLLVAPIGVENSHFAAAQAAGVPVVAIDRPVTHVETDTVLVDNLEAAFKATRHLIEHGHREIVCIADDERIYTKNQRVLGYSRAMREARLPARVCIVGPMTGAVTDQLPLFLDSKPRPTAIFAGSNHVGIDVLRYLQERSIQMPQGIAFVCFDDFNAATLVSPAITVVQQPVAEIGQRGAEMMLERLKNRNNKPPARVTIGTRLVIRKSCGC
ncbi:MAG TPA: LacI family DNA-binding transcriptional regulator [Terracidiphilus sp.]